jgi:hypothetical protein
LFQSIHFAFFFFCHPVLFFIILYYSKKYLFYLSRSRLLHRRGTTTLDLFLLGLLDALGKQLLVFSLGFTRSFRSSALKSLSVSLTLKSKRGDETLDLGSLGVSLLTLSLGLNLTTNDILADIIFLGQVLIVIYD